MSETQSSATLHFLCGKIASGKSTLAQQLVRGQQAVLLSEDTGWRHCIGTNHTAG